MSRQLHTGAESFSTSKPLSDVEKTARIGNCKGGGAILTFDIDIRADDIVDKTRYRIGDVVLAFNDNEMTIYRVTPSLTFKRVNIK